MSVSVAYETSVVQTIVHITTLWQQERIKMKHLLDIRELTLEITYLPFVYDRSRKVLHFTYTSQQERTILFPHSFSLDLDKRIDGFGDSLRIKHAH